MPSFRERLREALDEARARGTSQADVARQIKATSASRLVEWKAGKGAPDPAELLALAQVLEVEVGWLAGGKDPKHRPPPAIEVEGFRDIAAIVDRVRALARTADLGERSLPGEGADDAKSAGGA